MNIRSAVVDDAADIAHLTNLAGEGLPEYLWTLSAEPGQSAIDCGIARARRETGTFSYRNAWILEASGEAAGMLLALPQPDPFELPDFDTLPAQVRPLIELEARAPGSFYINAIGVYERFQGLGYGKALMAHAETLAGMSQIATLSLIVGSENHQARGLYRHLGYLDLDRLPVVPYPGIRHGGDWILMTKSI